jgi:hypothetical protein
VLLVAVAALIAAVVRAAFDASLSHGSNAASSGTVSVSDNDGGSASMLSLDGASLGATDTSCIRVTSNGSLNSDLRHYATVGGNLAPYLTLKVTRGSGAAAFDDCSGFAPDSTDYIGAGQGVIYDDKLSAYAGSYSAGLVDPRASTPETWSAGESHDYKFQITVDNDPLALGKSATATFHWETRNQ